MMLDVTEHALKLKIKMLRDISKIVPIASHLHTTLEVFPRFEKYRCFSLIFREMAG